MNPRCIKLVEKGYKNFSLFTKSISKREKSNKRKESKRRRQTNLKTLTIRIRRIRTITSS